VTPDDLVRFLDELDEWARRRGGPVEKLAYGDHADQVVDVRRPESPKGDALVLVLHGGFWRAQFTRRTTTALSVALTESGYITANVEYRRLGPGSYRPLLDDVRSARELLARFDTAVAIGHSAGGHLALWLAAEGAVDAAVALGGVCDLAAAADARLGNDAVEELLGGSSDQVPDAYDYADPAARLPFGRRQVLVHGSRDDRVPLDHARRYAERAAAAGDDCLLVEVDADHFAPIDPRSVVWPTLVDVVSPLCAEPVEADVP
jgi:acetyl esterase/lipase